MKSSNHTTNIEQQQIQDYISQLTSIEKKVLEIAESHLESSFDMVKSIGFLEWLKVNKNRYDKQ